MRDFNFKEEFQKSIRYIEESRNFIYFIVGVFFVFGFIGFFFTPPEEISKQIFEYIRQLLERTGDYGVSEMVGFIFFNNLKSSFIGLFSGIFLGIFSLINAIANGYLLGFVSLFTVAENGGFFLWRLLPHGIFELPAIFVSLGLGLKLGSFVFEKEKISFLRRNILNSLRVFLLVVVPLLLIGSIIEGILIFLI